MNNKDKLPIHYLTHVAKGQTYIGQFIDKPEVGQCFMFFYNGDMYMRTSTVQKIEGNLIHTKNSVYKLELAPENGDIIDEGNQSVAI